MSTRPSDNLPKRPLAVSRGMCRNSVNLLPEIHALLKDYADQTDTTITDVANRALWGFFRDLHGFDDPNDLFHKVHATVFPDKQSIR